jgi:hypothetical protein
LAEEERKRILELLCLEGLYRVNQLTLGTYNLTVKKQGFKDIPFVVAE